MEIFPLVQLDLTIEKNLPVLAAAMRAAEAGDSRLGAHRLAA
jgi:hypothetical protein